MGFFDWIDDIWRHRKIAKTNQKQRGVVHYLPSQVGGFVEPDSCFGNTLISGGNAQKVVVAREVNLGGKLLIASQPTRGVDIGAIESIRSIIQEVRDKGLAVLLVSAELEEVMSLSDRIIVMHEGKITGRLTADEADEENIGLLMMGGHDAE